MSLRFTVSEAKALGIKIPKEVEKANKQKRQPSPIQVKLYELLLERFPSLQWEYKNSIPGRKFALDMAFEEEKLAIEVDGWEFHGKYLQSFKNDRIKQNLLVQNGWVVLRFFAEEINQRPEDCIAAVTKTLAVIRASKSPKRETMLAT